MKQILVAKYMFKIINKKLLFNFAKLEVNVSLHTRKNLFKFISENIRLTYLMPLVSF